MKTLLIAAGMAASLFMAAPALAAPVAGTGVAPAPQDMRSDRRIERREVRREVRRGPGWNDGRRGWNDRRGWRGQRCHNVRRHHRWVRVCTRR